MPVKAKKVKTPKTVSATKMGKLPYRSNEHVRAAGLYNLRDGDIKEGAGIPVGAVVEGAKGYCLAEKAVPGYTAKVVKYVPNCKVKFGNATVAGMVLKRGGNVLNYAVVTLSPGRRHTVELDRFKGQDMKRRAELVQS